MILRAIGWLLRDGGFFSRGMAVLLLGGGAEYGRAQVVLDGKFGTSGALTGPNYNITAGMGATRGNNLFQSFTEFDLKAGDVATFSGPANIQNILSRVTGGGVSSIDGTIRSGIAGANLYFINPNGVLFGPNAVVDVSGSFAVSTANYLKLANGARFVAALDADDSTLSSGPVVAFGFLGSATGSIGVQGSLKAGSGNNLSVVGGVVSVADGAQLEAINGQISLVGMSGAGEVTVPATLPPTAGGATPPGAGNGAGSVAGGDVVIRGGRLLVNNAAINASTTGGDIDITLSEGMQVVNGGSVTTTSAGAIKGGNIVIDSPSLLVDGQNGAALTQIAAETTSDSPLAGGGNVIVHSGSVELRGGGQISVSTAGAADAGRVDITTSSLVLEGADMPQNGTQISADAAQVVIDSLAGSGGQIVIHANSIEIGNGAEISASSMGNGNAGSIQIDVGSLLLKDGGITTYAAGAGAGGHIQIQSDDLTLDGPFATISALTTAVNSQLAAGNGGSITLKTGSLRLLNDAGISANTYGDGQGGNINVTADSILLDTATFPSGSIPGITASSTGSSGGNGSGGNITIVDSGPLTLRNGMPISTTTFTAGGGGNLNITAGSVSLDGQSSIQSASQSAGPAGTISVQSSGNILLSGNTTISTSAPLSSGGDIHVQAGGQIRLLNSQITAQAGPGGGGDIKLAGSSLTYLLNSTLNAQAVGDGGNLTIDPVFFILNNSPLVSKSATKNGGNITILSDYFFRSSSPIDASAPFGLPGTVTVSAPEVDLSGSLIGLPSNLLDVETQLQPDCGVRLTGNISSFTVIGQGGLPIEPGGFVPSQAAPPRDEK